LALKEGFQTLLKLLLAASLAVALAAPVWADAPTVESHIAQAHAYERIGRFGDAERELQDAVRVAERMGPRHPKLISTLAETARYYETRGNNAKAEIYLRRELSLWESVQGKENRDVVTCMQRLAGVELNEGHFHDAESTLRESLQTLERMLDRDRSHREVDLSKDRLAIADCLDQLVKVLQQDKTNSNSEEEAKVLQQRSLRIRANPSADQ